jgi:signal transduction histidine kinase
VDPADDAALRRALEEYYAAADDVSGRLIGNESGESMIEAIAAMQEKQGRFAELLQKTTTFDRHELVEAFAAAVRAEGVAKAYRLWISVACLGSVILLSTWMSRGVLRSLGELKAGFERFGTGNFEQPIRLSNRDEIGDLAERANQMATSLERFATALKLSNQELEAFSYSVAHDLRAPLRGMNGFAQILLDTYKDKLDEEGQDCLEEIMLNAKKMGGLIDALLSLARVTRSDLQLERVDLSAMVRDAAARLASSESHRTVQIEAEDDLHVDMDSRLARALIENLLGNAWKFTCKLPVGRIEFGATEKAGVRAFFVRDNGAGFDMAFAGKLFAPFQRLHTAAEFPGTGIGLATVQRILHRHRGRIWAEGSVDGGATFYFSLPTS